jgi:hypothetical protein
MVIYNRRKQMKGRKTGGRVAGTPNRITTQLRASLAMVLQGEIDQLPQHLARLSPAQRVSAVLKVAELLLPSLSHWDQLQAPHDWAQYIHIETTDADADADASDHGR